MKTLKFEQNQNVMEVAQLVRQARIRLKKKDKEKYQVKAVADAIGCSVTHYERLEHGEKEIYHVKWLYGIAKVLEIPLDKLVGTYLGLTEQEIKKNFTIMLEDSYCRENSLLMKEKRKLLSEESGTKVVQKDISEYIGCSKSHLSHMERGQRTFKDIRLLYGIAEKLEIPLWVLIRNELNLQEQEIQRVISYSPQNSVMCLRRKLIEQLEMFSPKELEMVEDFLKIMAKMKNEEDN